jgi:Zn-finger nucleic acid-binding protein
MVRNCPRCNVGMKLEDRLGVEIDKCPKCKGMWFDNNELDKLSGGKALEGSIFTARVLGKELKCPACTTDMEYMTVEGVTIDHCPQCEGVWLDDGELKNLRLSMPQQHQFGKEDAPYAIEEEKPKNVMDHFKKFFHKKE